MQYHDFLYGIYINLDTNFLFPIWYACKFMERALSFLRDAALGLCHLEVYNTIVLNLLNCLLRRNYGYQILIALSAQGMWRIYVRNWSKYLLPKWCHYLESFYLSVGSHYYTTPSAHHTLHVYSAHELHFQPSLQTCLQAFILCSLQAYPRYFRGN